MMSKQSIIILLAACVVAALLISGCTQSATPAPAATAASTAAPTAVAAPGAAGMANPASVNCGKIGGQTEIKTAADGGQYGMCTFTNGTSCEEWALYRGEGCKANVSVAATTVAATPASGSAGMANPASVNCGKVGGQTEIKTAADGGQYGMCTFTNGTSCEEWALFRGEGCKANVSVATTTAAPAK